MNNTQYNYEPTQFDNAQTIVIVCPVHEHPHGHPHPYEHLYEYVNSVYEYEHPIYENMNETIHIQCQNHTHT